MMKAQGYTRWLTAGLVVLLVGMTAGADEGRPYMGVRLDPEPLPELLAKHLRLEPEQGLVITNVQKDSPADEAGLDRDDIIVSYQGEEVWSMEEFVERVQEAEVGHEVKLEVIHLGERREVELELGRYPQAEARGAEQWKYPLREQPQLRGRMFRRDPGQQQWQQVPLPSMPEMDDYFRQYYRQTYSYEGPNGTESFTVTIEGDPRDEDSEVTVESGNQTYTTRVGEIEALPEEFREAAEDALGRAEDSGPMLRPRSGMRDLPGWWGPWKHQRQQWWDDDDFGGDEAMEEQLEEMQRRMRELERQMERMLR